MQEEISALHKHRFIILTKDRSEVVKETTLATFTKDPQAVQKIP